MWINDIFSTGTYLNTLLGLQGLIPFDQAFRLQQAQYRLPRMGLKPNVGCLYWAWFYIFSTLIPVLCPFRSNSSSSSPVRFNSNARVSVCLLYTSDAADE